MTFHRICVLVGDSNRDDAALCTIPLTHLLFSRSFLLFARAVAVACCLAVLFVVAIGVRFRGSEPEGWRALILLMIYKKKIFTPGDKHLLTPSSCSFSVCNFDRT